MNAARDIAVVAGREIVERGRSVYYLGSVLLTLVLVVGVIALPALLEDFDEYTLGVVGEPPGSLLQVIARTPDADVITLPLAGPDAAATALREERVDAVLTRVPSGGYELLWQSDHDPLLSAVVTAAVADVQIGERATALGVDPVTAEALLAAPVLTHRSVEEPDPEQEGRWWLALVMLLLLFMTITTYGSFVLTGVVEEKSSRVVELLLARIAPRHLLAGKVAGIGLLGLAQAMLLVAAAVGTMRLVPRMPGPVPSIPAGALIWLVVWFVLGYAFYSMAYGAVGALASRSEDAQTATAPLTFTILAVFWFVYQFVADDLGGVASTVASFVPISAPLVMPLRLAFGEAALWEAGAAVAVMAVAIYGLVRLAGRVYTGSILRTGRRVRLREAWSNPR
jgi:ABC-2 type transport system permease protein